MRDKLIWFIIIAMSINILCAPLIGHAEGKIEVSTKVKGASVEYKIKNKTESVIEAIRIDEKLKDRNGNVIDSSSIEGGEVGAGADASLSGKAYSSHAGNFNVEYSIKCKIAGVEGMQDIVSGEQKLNLSDIRISVSYSAHPSGTVLKDTSVAYTAELESKSDMPIYNVVVIDSVHGELGKIEVLEPNKKVAVSKSFKISESAESYIILKFDDPFSDNEKIERALYDTKLAIDVSRTVPEPKIAMSVKPDKSAIDGATDVTFNIDITNTGNVTLTNIRLTDWNGKAFDVRDRLKPGETYSAKFTGKIEPDKTYKISCTASAEGTDKGIGTFYEVKLGNAKASVEIDRKITPDAYKIGDSITLEYIIRNNGNVGLKDIKLEEPKWQGRVVGEIEHIEPGEEKTVSIRIDLTAPITSQVVLTGYNTVTGEEYRYEAVGLPIGGGGREKDTKIEIELKSDPEELEEPGTVVLECLIKNIGSGSLKNVEVLLKDRDIVLGSFVELAAGSEETIRSTALDVNETTTFRVVVKGINSVGNRVEYTSGPLTVEVGKATEDDDGKRDGKLAILKTVMAVLTLLIIFVAGTLIYTAKNPKNAVDGVKGDINESDGEGKGDMSGGAPGGMVERTSLDNMEGTNAEDITEEATKRSKRNTTKRRRERH